MQRIHYYGIWIMKYFGIQMVQTCLTLEWFIFQFIGCMTHYPDPHCICYWPKNVVFLLLTLVSTGLFLFSGKFNQSFRVDKDDNGCLQVRLIDRSYIKALANQVRDILATDPEGSMLIQEFTKVFKERWENFLYQA